MADKKQVPGPTRVSKGAYNPTQKMTPEQAKTIEEGGKATRAEQLKKRAAKVYRERSQQAPMQQQARPKADVSLRQVTPKKTPKKYAAPKAALGRKGPGQMQREAAAKPKVDLKTGKPKPTKTYGERAISYLEGLGTRVAPPGSVTRLRETGARAPRTMSERLGSIGRTASRTFPGKATRPGGILDIPALAGESRGPSLKAQKGTPAAAKRRAAMSLAEKKRRGLRVTGADVPGHGKARTRGEGIPEIKRVGEAGLGEFRGRGTKAPPPPRPKAKPRPRAKAKPKAKVPWYIRAGRAFKKAGAEMQQQSRTSTAPSGKYGTKKQAQKGAKAVKKAVVPKKFKEK